MIEVDSLEDLDALLATRSTLHGVVLQGLDLCGRTKPFLAIEVAGGVFLGCLMDPALQERLYEGHALVFPPFPDLPFRAFRSELYTPNELFAEYVPGNDASFADALDTRVYQWSQQALQDHDVVKALAQRIHDHAVDDALLHLLEEDDRQSRVVAIMGGHGMGRNEPAYADVVRLTRTLTRQGFFCASGGGPGAMEATNLGAWLAPHPDDALDEALGMLAAAPGYQPMHAWLETAMAVRQRFPLPDGEISSLGVPTWHYGHEPPNVFASHIAKYFANSIREDGLLAIARAGVVFAPGSAGTIQEIFQDAAQNHYESFGVSPMVFMNTHYWTQEKPVYPLLEQLAQGRAYAESLAIYDQVDDIVAHLRSHVPSAASKSHDAHEASRGHG